VVNRTKIIVSCSQVSRFSGGAKIRGEHRKPYGGWSRGWNENVRRVNGGCAAGIIGKQGDMFAKCVMPYALATANANAGGITSESVCLTSIVLLSHVMVEVMN